MQINAPITFSFDDIAWKSDVNKKFGIPPGSSWAKTVKPPNWPKSALEFDPEAYRGFQRLIVWMRTSALPNFRKNYGALVQTGEFVDGLPAGNYTLRINYGWFVFTYTCSLTTL